MQIENIRLCPKTPSICVLATLLVFCAGLAAQAQETGLWGTLKDAESLEALTGHVSIIHAARPNIQFFHAQASLFGMYEMNWTAAGGKDCDCARRGLRVCLEAGYPETRRDTQWSGFCPGESSHTARLGGGRAGPAAGQCYRATCLQGHAAGRF